MKTNKALSSIFNCNTSDIQYLAESSIIFDEISWNLEELLDTELEKYIKLEPK